MQMTARFAFRCEDSLVADVDEIACRTGLRESEVVRRLVRLGLQDVDEIGEEVLFGAVSGPYAANGRE